MSEKWPAFIAAIDPTISGWVEGPGEDVHIKVVEPGGDPVELPPAEVRLLAAELIRLAELAERDDGPFRIRIESQD